MSGMHDGKIRVLQIAGNARLGGVASFLLNYCRHTDFSRLHFDFVTYGPSPFDGQIADVLPDARVFYIRPFTENFVKATARLAAVCREGKYDAVHSHLTTLSPFALFAAARAGVPVRICHAHSTVERGGDHLLAKRILRPFAASYATHLAACSRYAAENIFGRRAKDAAVITDAIEAERFYCDDGARAETRASLGLHGKTVLYTGRFEYQKNLPLLLRAFALASEGEDMTLALVGDGSQKERLLGMAEELGIAQKVLMVPPCDPAPWYKAADVFCLPSRYEGLGMSAIEAQAAGLKCLLSTNVPKEADITGHCTFLPDDEVAWAEAMRQPPVRFYDVRGRFEASGYDIALGARTLPEFYENAVCGAAKMRTDAYEHGER